LLWIFDRGANFRAPIVSLDTDQDKRAISWVSVTQLRDACDMGIILFWAAINEIENGISAFGILFFIISIREADGDIFVSTKNFRSHGVSHPD